MSSSAAKIYTRKPTGDFRVTFISDQVYSLGYSPTQFTSDANFWMDHIHPADQEKVRSGLESLWMTGSHQHEYRFKIKDGSYILVRDEFSLVDDEAGAAKEIAGFWTEITNEISAQQHYKQLFKLINQTAIVATTDQYGKINYVNENFCKISGYSAEELIGKDHRLVNSGYHPKEFFEGIWQTFKGGEPWHGQIRNRRKDGSFYWVDSTLAPFVNNGVEGYIGIRFDITAEKECEKKLLLSSKMASLGEMASGIAHEINNPLTIINGKAMKLRMQLAQETVDPEKTREALWKIEATTERIAKIIKGLRSFSRNAEQDPMEEVQLSKIIDDTLELCRERFKNHGIELRLDCSPDILVECRATQISQVLLNLLGNAHDAIEMLPERWVSVEVTENGNTVDISVRDSGTGIPEDIAQKIMDPFFTTKEVGKGTGLGLSISKGIAEAHKGSLFYDASSKNTHFVFELPARQILEEVGD